MLSYHQFQFKQLQRGANYINQVKARQKTKVQKREGAGGWGRGESTYLTNKYNILVITQMGPDAPRKLEKQLKSRLQEQFQTHRTHTSEDSMHGRKRPSKVEEQLLAGKEKRNNGLGEVI